MFENSGSVGAVPPQPESRSESLARTFKQFMEADQQLHVARRDVSECNQRAEQARQHLARAEDAWVKSSTVLAHVLAADAPPQVHQLLQRDQASWVGPIPPNGQEDTAPIARDLGSQLPRRW